MTRPDLISSKRLKELLDHPLVGEVRSLGLIGAIEMVKDKAKRKTFEPVGNAGTVCRDHCIRNGLMLRATRDTMLISPLPDLDQGPYRRVHLHREEGPGSDAGRQQEVVSKETSYQLR